MRSNKPFLVATFLVAWICITYFLWARQATIDLLDDDYKMVYRRLNQLEADVQREDQNNRLLVQRLLVVVQNIDKINAIEEAVSDDVLLTHSPALSVADGPTPIRTAAAREAALKSAALSYEQHRDLSVVRRSNVTEIDALAIAAPHLRPQLIRSGNASRNRTFRGPVIPILVFACNRVSVAKCLDNLLEYRPNVHQFPIVVSQDCADPATRTVIESYADVQLISQPDQSDIALLPKEKKFKGYYKIARHYGWALNETFRRGYDFVVVVEDDLNVAPDFYEYFLGTHELLLQDRSLWCVSAWNDNGKAGVIDEGAAALLYRTDFFPGLGWMLTKELWAELAVKWPVAFWDDWIRQPQQRKERACIRPEISRTRTFGKVGVSNGLFFEKHLRFIKLSEQFVPFSMRNLTGLLQRQYDDTFLAQVYACPVVTYDELRRGIVESKGAVRIQYITKEQYKRTAKLLRLMDDFKSGVPRTGYHGIVSFFYNNQRVHLAPSINWKGYDMSWS